MTSGIFLKMTGKASQIKATTNTNKYSTIHFSSTTLIACFLEAGVSAFATQSSCFQTSMHSTFQNMAVTIDIDSDTCPVYDPF